MGQSPPPAPLTTGNALQGFTSIAEYNIAALASLAENGGSAAASPSPPFTLAELLTNDTAYKNLASLAKLGLNSSEFFVPFVCGVHLRCFSVRSGHIVKWRRNARPF